MKIIFLLDLFETGGVTDRTLRQAKYLKAIDSTLNVEIFAFKNLSAVTNVDEVNIEFGSVLKLIRKTRSTKNIVICCQSGRAFSKVFWFRFFKQNVKIFVIQAVPLVLKNMGFVRNSIRLGTACILFPFAHKIITVSEALSKLVSRLPMLTNVEYVPNPVINAKNYLVRIETKKNTDKLIRMVAIGRLSFQKNLTRALNILSYLPHNYTLDFIGMGDTEDLRRLSSKLGLDARVNYRGHIRDDKSFLREYDIILLTSYWEGLPSVLIEGIYSGLFPIAADCETGPREIIEKSGFGMLFSLDEPNIEIANRIVNQTIDNMSVPNRFLSEYDNIHASKKLLRALIFDT